MLLNNQFYNEVLKLDQPQVATCTIQVSYGETDALGE